MPTTLEAFFRPTDDGGYRLYLHQGPSHGTARGSLLLVHPWAEEMNKSRHVAARLCRDLADEGWATLRLDLLGCGDSSGDFGDASWQLWIDDVVSAASWLHERHPRAPRWLGGLRAGALLAAEAAAKGRFGTNLLFIQPARDGRQHLQQFLRMASAARWTGTNNLPDVRAMLAGGEAVEIAGYRLSPALADGLARARLEPAAAGPSGRMLWIDVVAGASAQPNLATEAVLARWRDAGWAAVHETVTGPPFWQSVEVEPAPALLTAARRLMARSVEIA